MTEGVNIGDRGDDFTHNTQDCHPLQRKIAQRAVAPCQQTDQRRREYAADQHILPAVHLGQEIFCDRIADGEGPHGEKHENTCTKIR